MVGVVAPGEVENGPTSERDLVTAPTVPHERLAVVVPPCAVQLDRHSVAREGEVDLGHEASVGPSHTMFQRGVLETGIDQQVSDHAAPVAEGHSVVVKAILQRCAESVAPSPSAPCVRRQHSVEVRQSELSVPEHRVDGAIQLPAIHDGGQVEHRSAHGRAEDPIALNRLEQIHLARLVATSASNTPGPPGGHDHLHPIEPVPLDGVKSRSRPMAGHRTMSHAQCEESRANGRRHGLVPVHARGLAFPDAGPD